MFGNTFHHFIYRATFFCVRYVEIWHAPHAHSYSSYYKTQLLYCSCWLNPNKSSLVTGNLFRGALV